MRISAQKSPGSELRSKRYKGLKFRGQNWNFGKIQGHIWEYRLFGAFCVKRQGCNFNLEKDQGSRCKE
jgi:hypothetical protein